MLPATSDFLRLSTSQFFKVLRAFGFSHEIQHRIVVPKDRPVGIVFPIGVSIWNQAGNFTKSLMSSRSFSFCGEFPFNF